MDQKRARSFAKLIRAVSLAAQIGTDPESNIRLRNAIEKAHEAQVAQDTIERAIRRTMENGPLKELVLEAYGPGGTALMITIITDNRNRTIPEIKKILSENGGKWAASGSVRWSFSHATDREQEWTSKFPLVITDADRKALDALVNALESHNDVEVVHTNAAKD